jgi:hypothetical protein
MKGLLGVVNPPLSIDFLDNYELSLLNNGKVGEAIQNYALFFSCCPIPILHAI